MNGLPNVEVIRSVSFFGLSSVDIVFKDGTDNYFARQQVFERIGDVGLPDGVSAGIEPLFSPSGLVYRYVLDSPDRTPMELKTINDWVISKAYKSVSGVADMSGFGGPTMQYQVLFDPNKLAGAGLAVPDVANALANNNGNSGGGFYSEGGQFYYVRGLGRLGDARGYRQCRAGHPERHTDSGEGYRPCRDRICPAHRPLRIQQHSGRRRGRDPDADRRAGPDRPGRGSRRRPRS